ncbi:MAG TPA: hypothetical protein VFI22_13635, partial [Thermomicrobiales bacterium]|nr:hypothetical protein [Thermomicrobiales bacterium]
KVDESMTSSPTTFDPVVSATKAEFPVQTPDVASLQQAAASAEAAASTARTFGIAGIVLGAIGIVVGAFGLARGRRPGEPPVA